MNAEQQLAAARIEIGELRTALSRREGEAAHLASIVDSSDDAMVGQDLVGVVTSWNAGAEKIFGYAAAEMIGQSISKLIPAGRREEEQTILRRIARGESARHFEAVRVRRDGSMLDVSVWTSPIRDAAGEIVGASRVARDITEARKAEKAQAASELRYRRLFETAKDGILILDAETGMVVDVNPFLISLLGFSREQFLGKTVWDLGFFRDIVANEENFAELREKEYIRYENRPLETIDGRRIEVEFISNVYLVNGAKVIQCNVRDVSARRRAEEALRLLYAELEQRVIRRTAELEAANKELEAFSYSVSHDLRAPLRAVDGFSQAVLEDFGALLPEEGQRQLRTIRAGAQRMGALIDALLGLARLGRQEVNKREVDTARLVRETLAELGSPWPDRRVEVRIGELPVCAGDPALLKQVWVNLLSNALKYTRKRERAEIEIGCVAGAGTATFFVRDNGTGFDPRYAEKLFGVFQRLHRVEDYEGTGVGLAIVQRIVTRHGGRVWAEAAVDCGATFYFTLGKKHDL